MSTYTDTFNRDDIRRVYASFAADYKIVAEWTELHSAYWIEKNIAEIKLFAEDEYLESLHLQLVSSDGAVRRAAVYRVTTTASLWSADKPGDLHWTTHDADRLELIVFHSSKWKDLTDAQQQAFREKHNITWGTTDFDGNYTGLVASTDKHFASRAYGMARTQYGA
ncbi:MAG TPA: hypothetical protein VFX13_02030 [Gaiellales bacterium]|nr:hypothetical protein [Gaiellales bacterium]